MTDAATPPLDLLESVLDHVGNAAWPSEAYDPAALAARAGCSHAEAEAFLEPTRTFVLRGDPSRGFATGRRGALQVLVGRRRHPHGDDRPVEVVLFDEAGLPSGGESYMLPAALSYDDTLKLLEVSAGPIAVCRFQHPTTRYYGLLPFGPVEHGRLTGPQDGVHPELSAWVGASRALFVWEELEEAV